MSNTTSVDKLNSLRRQNSDNGGTKLNSMQPLNEIGGDTSEETFDEVLDKEKEKEQKKVISIQEASDNIIKGYHSIMTSPLMKIINSFNSVDNDTEEEEFIDGFESICDECQIKSIVGDCLKCGLYQYGDNYEIMLRRRQ